MIHQIISEIFSIGGLIAAIIGVTGDRLYWVARDKLMDRMHPENGPHRTTFGGGGAVVYVIGGFAVAYLLVQGQLIHGATISEVRCQNKQLQQARDDRVALAKWIESVNSPPKEIAALHTTDPIYQEWARKINADYISQLKAVELTGPECSA